jgi:hypothetical protein
VIPGVSRRRKTGVKARDINEVMRDVDRWKAEAVRAGRTISRVVDAARVLPRPYWQKSPHTSSAMTVLPSSS